MNMHTISSPKQHKHEQGFTLVEVLCAAMILAISAVVIGRMVIQHMSSLEMARQYQVAASLLDETFTKIDVIGPSRVMDEGITEGDFESHGMSKTTWNADVLQREEASYLYEVIVTIAWEVNGGKRSVSGKTLLYDPPGARSMTLAWEDL
ncbi:type IV pilus modification PilV family protein [Poriferisphaera sp. WC338]|uniref:type IV pilus modification PilV family protein n=1 Tax=Poriferisphaera sp. WC338 TaxID=3425129 RepID=UPI003D815E93